MRREPDHRHRRRLRTHRRPGRAGPARTDPPGPGHRPARGRADRSPGALDGAGDDDLPGCSDQGCRRRLRRSGRAPGEPVPRPRDAALRHRPGLRRRWLRAMGDGRDAGHPAVLPGHVRRRRPGPRGPAPQAGAARGDDVRAGRAGPTGRVGHRRRPGGQDLADGARPGRRAGRDADAVGPVRDRTGLAGRNRPGQRHPAATATGPCWSTAPACWPPGTWPASTSRTPTGASGSGSQRSSVRSTRTRRRGST